MTRQDGKKQNSKFSGSVLKVFCQENSVVFAHPFLICAMVKSRYIGDPHPTFDRNPYINPTFGLMTIPYCGNNGKHI